ncbi:MAG: hypothetical protein E7160_02580 [Firmicutes bacterium]|nr:hypothetical protein [Bacillota bacterium]
MKKIIIFLAIIITILSLNKEEKVVIPKNSIRFRVIANSNSKEDQIIKKKIVYNLSNNILELENKNMNIENSREYIKNTLPEFKQVIEQTLNNQNYKINYGINHFPEKEYKGTVYEEGDYESLVITLGDGLGENFWCVLFPPLCLLEAEDEQDTTDIEYKSFIKEVIDKYF